MSRGATAHGSVGADPTPLFAADHLTLDDIQVEQVLGSADRRTVPAGYDAVFEPEAMRLQARAAGAQGKPWFQWGYSIDPSAGDPRQIQFGVRVTY